MFRLLAFLPMRRTRRKTPRRSPRQDRSLESVRAILEAAAQVLLDRGYAGATTNHIALAAGVSIGTLYQYFPNKDAVFDTLILRYFEEILRRIRATIIDGGDPLEVTLHRIIAAGLEAQRYGPELLRALEAVPNAVFRRRLTEGKRQLVDYVRALLEDYRRVLRVTDLERAARLIVNAAEGIGYNESRETFDERLADELTTLFVRYLVGPTQ
jgi:AcrR family transcriptional regulator